MTLFQLPESWHKPLAHTLEKQYVRTLSDFLQHEDDAGKVIFPPRNEIFAALQATDFSNIKVVLIGQDPYHGEGQAMGLSFSVRDGVKLPPSLRNIYKELEAEYRQKPPISGDLTHWAKQGVLLLNATLTVESGLAGSHQNKGWEELTDAIIHAVNDAHENLVFLLWGSYAQKKGAFIDRKRHLVLESAHPSPLSAHRGFLGNGHFKKTNEYLKNHGKPEIKWL